MLLFCRIEIRIKSTAFYYHMKRSGLCFALKKPEAELQAARSEHLSSLRRVREVPSLVQRPTARGLRCRKKRQGPQAEAEERQKLSTLASQSCTPEPIEKQQSRVRHA